MKTTFQTSLYKWAAALLVLVVGALAFGVLAGSTGAASSPFTAVDLGTLGGGYSSARAVNDGGQVVGDSTTASGQPNAFSWTLAGGMVDLGTLGGSSSLAIAVNDGGQVVGFSYTASGPQHAFSWTLAGGMVDLGTLGGSSSFARAVNDGGQAVGDSTTASGQLHAFSWTQAGGMVDLGTLGGSFSSASAVNDGGQVVGYSTTASGPQHAFSWTQAGGMVNLGTLGGSSSSASAVNDGGQVVGFSSIASGQQHAFSWTQAGGMVDLGTFGGSESFAYAVNGAGQVVGYSDTASGQLHAFSWTQAGGMVDLGTLGGSYSSTGAVNDAGQVVGVSNITGNTALHAFSWTQAGGMVDLGTVGGSQSSANAVNASGQVVGGSDPAIGQHQAHATLWRPADSIPPVAPSQPDLAAASDSGVSDSDNVTSSTTLTFTGMAESGSTVTLYRGSTVAGTADAAAVSGAWALSDTVATDGSFGYTAKATDAAGNTSSPSLALLVKVDTVAPVLSVPAGVAVDATSPGGAVVGYTVSGIDGVDPAPVVACSPASGAVFAVGNTTVTCTAKDAAGNTTTGSFVVHVRGAAEQFTLLRSHVASLGLRPLVAVSLDFELRLAQTALAQGKPGSARTLLGVFVVEVRVLPARLIAPADAADLIAAATRISRVLY